MRSLLTSVALTAALVVVVPTTSHAQDAEDAEITKMAKEHYRLGVEAFKAAKYPDAIKELKKAYLLKRLPPLLVNIAKTYEKLNDLDNAIYYYKKYLAEAPADATDRGEIKKALADAQARKDNPPEAAEPEAATRPGGGGDEPAPPPPPKKRPEPEAEPEVAPPPPKKGTPVKPTPKPEAEPEATPPPKKGTAAKPPEATPEPTPPPKKAAPDEARPARQSGSAGEWTHNPVDSAPPNTCLDVKVQTPVMKGVKVFLFYRSLGESEFTKVEMKRKGADKRARIPAESVAGKSIQYYLEAIDSTGQVVKNAGTQLDPNIVYLDPTAAPQCADAETGPECAEDDLRCQEDADRARREAAAKESKRRARAEYCDKHPLECKQPGRNGGSRAGGGGGSGGPTFSGLGWGGIGLAAAGAVVAGVGGGLGFYYAQLYSDQVYNDSIDPNCRNTANPALMKGQKCFFNDPQITPTDLDFQNRGKTWGMVAPIAIGAGAAMVAGGVAMAVIDYMKLHPSSAPEPSRKRSPGKRPSKSADETPAEQSSIQHLMVLPTISPTLVGVGAGFQF